jgi:hypothetical protein
MGTGMSTPEPVSIDPVAAVKAAPVHFERVPGTTYQPPPAEEGEELPPPVTVPEQLVLAPSLADLPPELVNPVTGRINLGSTVAVLWQLLHSLEIRAVTGRVLLESAPGGIGGTIWRPGQSAELTMTWDSPAPMVPTGLLVTAETSIVNAAKIGVAPVEGTLTTTGGRVRAENISSQNVIVNANQPVLIRGRALYLYTPPLTSEGAT